MNIIWGVMILAGMVYGMVTGRVEAVSDAVLSSAKEAVTLCITMLGVMALWMGLMKIAEESGIIHSLSKRVQPLIRFLFPGIPEGHPANEHITMNCVANFLGLGWAATPAGLKAMEALAQLEEERRMEEGSAGGNMIGGEKTVCEGKRRMEEGSAGKVMSGDKKTGPRRGQSGRSPRIPAMPRGVASNEMCTFLIINISSLQLIPVNVIAYRAQYGSVNPTAIVGPGIVATAVSTLAAVAFCRVMDGKRRV